MPAPPDHALDFAGFRLDPASGRLLRDGRPVPLAPKAFAVLRYLASRPGQLVGKQELLTALWPGVFVGDAVLKVTIRDIRKALGDDSHAPRFIETAHRRGYRFIAEVAGPSSSPVPPVPPVPPVHYARSGQVNVAYQVVGSGPIDLVFVMGWVSHLEYFWREPRFARFLTRLGSMARLILFDKRGTGLSDPVPVSQLPTLEERLDDVRAVMEAVGSDRAVLMGVSEGGPLCTLFAATYPERTEALVTIGSYARRFEADDYPWGQTREQFEAFCGTILHDWGGPVGIAERAPSLANDPAFRDWWASYLRMGASPGAAVALTRMNAQIDIRDVLPCVRVPTLVLHRVDDRCLPADGSRYLASMIPGAEYVELPGADHLPFVGDQDGILEAIDGFLSRAHVRPAASHTLATVLVVRSGDGADRDAIDQAFLQEVTTHRGVRIAGTAEPLAATFDGPGRAVRCGRAVAEIADRLGISIRAAVHVGEFDPAAPAALIQAAATIVDDAPAGTVLVSRTVVDLVPGSGLQFTESGSVKLATTDRELSVFEVA